MASTLQLRIGTEDIACAARTPMARESCSLAGLDKEEEIALKSLGREEFVNEKPYFAFRIPAGPGDVRAARGSRGQPARGGKRRPSPAGCLGRPLGISRPFPRPRRGTSEPLDLARGLPLVRQSRFHGVQFFQYLGQAARGLDGGGYLQSQGQHILALRDIQQR